MCQEELTEVYIHLKDTLKRLSQTKIEDEFKDDELLKHLLTLQQILEKEPTDEQSRTLLALINKISNAISQILNSRYNLKIRQNVDVHEYANSSGELFNEISDIKHNKILLADNNVSRVENDSSDILTELEISLHPSENYEPGNDARHRHAKYGKRLPFYITDILNEWYDENIENPYLTKEDIIQLKAKTKLDERQIKNWASNKRRKRKEVKISPELYKVLGPKN